MKAIGLHAGNPGPLTGDGNWTYLIEGPRAVLIDAGVGALSHLDAIDAAAGDRQLHLVLTHAHSDHIAGAPAIWQRRPGTLLSKMPWPIRDPSTRDRAPSASGRSLRMDRDLAWTPLADGDLIETGEGALQVVHTPGHAPDHICLWHAESRTLFVGDMLVKGTTVVIPASHGGSVAEYLGSLDRLLRLNPARALPAHGPVIEDPAALIHHYIKHRADREEQVLAALQAGAVTVTDLVSRIYPGLQPALEGFARESVLAHLIKLESENRVSRDDRGWRPVY